MADSKVLIYPPPANCLGRTKSAAYNTRVFYVWLSILILQDLLWLTLVLFGLPGNWLMVLTTALFAWWRWDERVFSGGTLMAIAALAVLGELIEFFAGTVGARKAGASWRASLTGILGAILGAALAANTTGGGGHPWRFRGTLRKLKRPQNAGRCLHVCIGEAQEGVAEISKRRVLLRLTCKLEPHHG
jgi:hypothetical protein